MNPGAMPPTPPREPSAEDCCGQGCVNCVFDVYQAQVLRYRAELEQWRNDGEHHGDKGPGDSAQAQR